MKERDKFLTQAMGECWHEIAEIRPYHDGAFINICRCGERAKNTYLIGEQPSFKQTSFSTPDGFFKLWEWALDQEWWQAFHCSNESGRIWSEGYNIMNYRHLIHPDRFANAVYEYLTGTDYAKKP